MAAESSFDVVSKVDMQEVRNAVQQAVKDGQINNDRWTRYDQLQRERDQLTERRTELAEIVERQDTKRAPRPSGRLSKYQ